MSVDQADFCCFGQCRQQRHGLHQCQQGILPDTQWKHERPLKWLSISGTFHDLDDLASNRPETGTTNWICYTHDYFNRASSRIVFLLQTAASEALVL